VTVFDESGGDMRVVSGITDEIYSHVEGFPVSATVNVSKCTCYVLCSSVVIII
jgi:hypothetical protein